ncbi:hybrid sensor histidine kinase/response regulator [Sporolactobacillus laevolacticus]|uniref:hybrid sensor histidine kinase/response regulator n=1 Tax=Sporolactobacillus laevolacticus TaxID=33018 RepID=UPI0025B53598|nr:ATP-binding protein [Sporolactobacillus laevolacticus]MDN3954906.1 ATP-binding protein [Sporolactobacillus laevolacticus]
MKKRIEALAITASILTLIFAVLYITFTYNSKPTPKAIDGRLDLSKWNFSAKGPVPLNGEWGFYPNQLLTQKNVSSINKLTPEKVRVPGSTYSKMGSLGIATYTLRIKVIHLERVYGIKTSSIQMANRLIVNGVTVGQSGHPADQVRYSARNKPYAGYFTLHRGWNTIIVQVANYDLHGGGGITGPIFLGSAAQIADLHNKALAHDWIITASFLIIGLYYLGLYTQRKKDASLIIFSLVCLSVALYTSASGERVFYDLFESIPFWLYYRIQLLSVMGTCVSLLLYVHTGFRPYASKWIIRIGLIIGAMLSLSVIGFVGFFRTDLFFPFITVYLILSFLYAIYVFLLAVLHRVVGSVYLVVASVSMISYIFAQSASVYIAVPIYKITAFEPLIFLLMLALLMSLRFANAYQKINELSVQLIKTDKIKDEFLVRTSHEFKSPLHGIINISNAMIHDSDHPLSSEQEERLQLITLISNSLSQLIYDIIDFSKLKQGILVIKPQPIDVHSTVDVLLRIHQYPADQKKVRLHNRIPKQMAFIYADEIRFSQIVSNLLDNAIKHTANGCIEITAEDFGDKMEITVRDTGEGIEEKELPFIFEPFHSLDESLNQKGAGLGLTIVKQLVTLQNGEISVRSEKGKGTTFRFTLPVTKDEVLKKNDRSVWEDLKKEPEYTFPTPYYVNQGGKYTVLVADDSYANLKILIDALQSIDCDVIAVKNGQEAMEQIERQHEIDLAILDIRMPGVSGYEVCQTIRENYSLMELPVLMVTAAIEPKDKVATFDAGANDFLPKPFDLSELKARIGSLLGMKDAFHKALDFEMAFLQSQIKPHFLYNTLNSIVASSYTDAERSRKLTMDLADYLRGSFQFSNIQKRVPFRQELDFVRTYVEIEKARFKDRIKVDYDIDEKMYDVQIPPLLIQPLVENAIRHGIGKRMKGGTIKVSASIHNDDYFIKVEDDGVGISAEQLDKINKLPDSKRGVGMKNISRRLKYEFGTELKIQSQSGKGTCVSFQILPDE